MACFWFTQGKCQLYSMEQDMVLSILSRVPKARQDILACGHGCPDVEAIYIRFAQDPRTVVEDEVDVNARHMKSVNPERDTRKFAGVGQGIVMPVIPPKG